MGSVGWFGADGRCRARWDNWWRSWVPAIYFNSNERIRNLWTPPAAVSGNRIWLHLLHISDRLSPRDPARRHEKQSNEIIFRAIHSTRVGAIVWKNIGKLTWNIVGVRGRRGSKTFHVGEKKWKKGEKNSKQLIDKTHQNQPEAIYFPRRLPPRQKRSPSFQISHFIYQHLATLIMKSIN